MKRRALWKISVQTTPEAEEAVNEMLSRLFGTTAASYTDAESAAVLASVYVEAAQAVWRPKLRLLRAGISEIKRCGLGVGAGRISVQRVRGEDWAESWKRHFKPISVGGRLLVKPSWSGRAAGKNQRVVVLDPGLSFGTGQHPTTSFCLREIVRRRGRAKSFFDIGTGSGILAIAAAKLGYAPVRAIDFDPEAVRIARENARLNGVGRRVRIERADITSLREEGRYDLVCANLISTLHIAARGKICNCVRPGGFLVLAGILEKEFQEVARNYVDRGFKLAGTAVKKEWQSGVFIRERQS